MYGEPGTLVFEVPMKYPTFAMQRDCPVENHDPDGHCDMTCVDFKAQIMIINPAQ